VGFNKRRMDRERAAALRDEEERRRRELGRDSAQAQRLVSVWNSRAARRARPSFYPTIETATMHDRDYIPDDDEAASRLAPKGRDGRFDLYVVRNGRSDWAADPRHRREWPLKAAQFSSACARNISSAGSEATTTGGGPHFVEQTG
jgi:hypothetical protein